jgi:RNA polymerase sigma-70 factor (ECF subfamily)
MKALIGAEDVLQETFAEVFRRMGTFDGTTTDAFWGWISMIADHRLADMVRAQRSAKRNRGGRVTNVPKGGDMSTAGELFAILKLHEHTPSRSFARREAVSAVQVALASLKEEYRKALRMRYIEGLPVARIAEAMGRTEGSVNMLCNRGLTKLREAMGRASAYLSR